ncbi:MAG: hypothetical protein AAGB19_06390 [Cyanobacteria bacterium P01_F01_bin.3]
MKPLSAFRFLHVFTLSASLSMVAIPGLAGTIIIENPYERFPNRSSTTTTTTTVTPSQRVLVSPGLTASLSDLPNGIYRTVSPTRFGDARQLPLRVDRTLFTFRKLGNRVIGNLEFADRTFLACVSGTIEGNSIVGEAITREDSSFVIAQDGFTPSPALQLGNFVAGNRFTNSVLDLNGFRRIDTGTVAPPNACFSR